MRHKVRTWLRRPVSRRLLWGGLAVAAVLAGARLMHALATEPIDSFAACAQAGFVVAESEPPTCRVGGRTFVGPPSRPEAAGPVVASQPFELLAEGDHTGSYPRRWQVIRSQAEWQEYWRTVHDGAAKQPPLLPVNFATHDVVALSLGLQVTNYYDLRVTAIMAGPDSAEVSVTEVVPTVTCQVTYAPTNRYLMARTAKLPDVVSFRLSTVQREC